MNINGPITFSFGENWHDFVQKHFNEERIEIAQKHLLEFLELPHLQDKTFLDIGCGSGIHSLAACKAKAKKVISFDLDPISIKATTEVRNKFAPDSCWEVFQGSILDKSNLEKIEKTDIVYSWGVLHHTGHMWEAISNAVGLIKLGGIFYVALYTTTPKTQYWIRVKKKYNRASTLGKRWMEFKYIFRTVFLRELFYFRNPFKFLREYKKKRGMTYLIDARDWLGGYPYEDARPEEVLRFCRDKFNLELINLRTGEACTEYLFKKHEKIA